MSSLSDVSYSELCQKFADRLLHSPLSLKSNIFDDDDEGIEFDNKHDPVTFNYCWTTGSRVDSELMYATEEQCLYVSNGKILKDGSEAYTCTVKKCKGRVYLKKNKIAIKVADHTVSHGGMYNDYMELQCRSFMREECECAGAKPIKEIYDEAVIM